MTRNLLLCSGLSAALLAAACNMPADYNLEELSAPQAGTAPEEHAPEEQPPRSEQDLLKSMPPLVGLSLNEGERWVVDVHARRSFTAMYETIISAEITDLDEAARVGTMLHDELQDFVSVSPLDGPARDQLHVFMGAYIPTFGRLRTATTLEEAHAALARLEFLIGEYSNHFY